MNKIININLAGRLIPIDEAAYDSLRDYLNRLKSFFAREKGGDEIVRDMEDRMGELFQDKLKKGTPCIMLSDIDDMIKIMGSPEQIESEAGEEENFNARNVNNAKQAAHNDSENTRSHRLSRNKNDKMVGGVCGGIANHFNIDATIIRVALIIITLAWGSGLILYLLLWAILPEVDDQQPSVKRRLYRNPKQKVVGGVCSGIAAYANVDPIVPRVIFAAPLLGMIFFGILDSGIFFFPVLVGGLPTLVLLYIILWASLPEATTVAENLEMRGEKVDIHNLSQAIKGAEIDKNVTPKRSGLAQLIAVAIKIFVFFILGTILLALGSIIIAALMAMLGFTSTTGFMFPFGSLITENETYKVLIWVCIVLTLAIPFIGVMRTLVRVISGRKKSTNRWITGVMTVLFGAGVFGLFWIGGSIASDFKVPYTKTYELALAQPNNDTLLVRQMVLDESGILSDKDWDREDYEEWDNEGIRFRDDSTIAISNINLHFTNSPDNQYHLRVQKSANGRTLKRATKLAENVAFNYKQEGNVLLIPRDFVLAKNHPFRNQKISIEIQVPKGKVFKTEGIDRNMYTDRIFRVRRGQFSYETKASSMWDDEQYYRMGDEGSIESLDKNNTDTTTTPVKDTIIN